MARRSPVESSAPALPEAGAIEWFVSSVAEKGRGLYRDLAWRRTRDPYAVLVSEVMLQQTQVGRVLPSYERWLAEFPTFSALADAPLEPVLAAWQGLGYNRRALALKRAAEKVACEHGGVLPAEEVALRALPGIGPATAAGVLAFAFDRPAVYLETNVRSVVLHELLGDSDDVPDARVRAIVSAAMSEAMRQDIAPRDWYYALLDYGAHLKRTLPNPSRRSRHHARQSRFEGSRRQLRAALLRSVLAQPGLTAEEYAADRAPGAGEVLDVLEELAAEGFLVREGERWAVA